MKNSFHWNVFNKMWTSHTYKACTPVQRIIIEGEWQTEVKPNLKSNPRGWVYCDHKQVILNPDLRNHVKGEKLVYDKENMSFNINNGNGLIFDEEGCFLIKGEKTT